MIADIYTLMSHTCVSAANVVAWLVQGLHPAMQLVVYNILDIWILSVALISYRIFGIFATLAAWTACIVLAVVCAVLCV